MTVELIAVGTEILLGNIVNTNAAYLAEKCAGLGLSCYYQSVVGDNEERLCGIIETALKRSHVVILTGGLGPTKDDLTKECVAKVLGRALYEDSHSRERIASYFEKRGFVITENNWKQAQVPEGAIVIDNDNGTAPGLIVTEGDRHVLLLPGPPGEMKPMFEKHMAPYLNRLQPEIIHSITVKLCGMGESMVETEIGDLIEAQSNPTIAPYAKTGEVHLRVTAKAVDEEAAMEMIRPVTEELYRRFGGYIYTSREEVTLEQAVVTLLEERNLTVAVAESCTGGMVAARLTKVPGVSRVFQRGFVTYSDDSKHQLLGVSGETLKRYGAVSRETAEEMARGAAAAAGAKVALSVTGIAGPEGGTSEKPVGLVYVACFVEGAVEIREFHFKGNRDRIRESSVANALTMLRRCILDAKH
ncbi:MAG: competence/damage-inducible protein A [Lachnospiraceae bacterium]|nr:competence/damage-inducible protein A [Lachnospiraceae bacterium]